MKKVLGFLLSLSMIASFATVTASAASVDVEDLDFYAADGVMVSAADATEPVDISACVDSDSPSSVPPCIAEVSDSYVALFAADGVMVSVADATEPVDISSCVDSDPARNNAPVARVTEVTDLADGSVSLDWNLAAESDSYNTFRYKTNTQKIKIHLTGDISVSLTVKLYNSSGSVVGTITKNVGTIFGTDYTFSNLTSAETYYYNIANNSPQDVHIVGTVSQ